MIWTRESRRRGSVQNRISCVNETPVKFEQISTACLLDLAAVSCIALVLPNLFGQLIADGSISHLPTRDDFVED